MHMFTMNINESHMKYTTTAEPFSVYKECLVSRRENLWENVRRGVCMHLLTKFSNGQSTVAPYGGDRTS